MQPLKYNRIPVRIKKKKDYVVCYFYLLRQVRCVAPALSVGGAVVTFDIRSRLKPFKITLEEIKRQYSSVTDKY